MILGYLKKKKEKKKRMQRSRKQIICGSQMNMYLLVYQSMLRLQ